MSQPSQSLLKLFETHPDYPTNIMEILSSLQSRAFYEPLHMRTYICPPSSASHSAYVWTIGARYLIKSPVGEFLFPFFPSPTLPDSLKKSLKVHHSTSISLRTAVMLTSSARRASVICAA